MRRLEMASRSTYMDLTLLVLFASLVDGQVGPHEQHVVMKPKYGYEIPFGPSLPPYTATNSLSTFSNQQPSAAYRQPFAYGRFRTGSHANSFDQASALGADRTLGTDHSNQMQAASSIPHSLSVQELTYVPTNVAVQGVQSSPHGPGEFENHNIRYPISSEQSEKYVSEISDPYAYSQHINILRKYGIEIRPDSSPQLIHGSVPSNGSQFAVLPEIFSSSQPGIDYFRRQQFAQQPGQGNSGQQHVTVPDEHVTTLANWKPPQTETKLGQHLGINTNTRQLSQTSINVGQFQQTNMNMGQLSQTGTNAGQLSQTDTYGGQLPQAVTNIGKLTFGMQTGSVSINPTSATTQEVNTIDTVGQQNNITVAQSAYAGINVQSEMISTASPLQPSNTLMSTASVPNAAQSIPDGHPMPTVTILKQQILKLPAVIYLDSSNVGAKQIESLLRDTYNLPLVAFYIDKLGNREEVEGLLEQLTAYNGLPYIFICGKFVGSLQHIDDYHQNGQIAELVKHVCAASNDRSQRSSTKIENV